MEPIELKSRREALGLSVAAFAGLLEVTVASVSRWESGKQTIKPFVGEQLILLEDQVETIVDLAAEMLEAVSDRPVHLRVWADDESFWADTDYEPLPAACYRVAMARARMLADDPNMTHLALP